MHSMKESLEFFELDKNVYYVNVTCIYLSSMKQSLEYIELDKCLLCEFDMHNERHLELDKCLCECYICMI
jgi:hypothetical protein